MDQNQLVAAAVEGAVKALAGEAVGGAKALGGKVWAWIKAKASPNEAAAVAQVEADPTRPSTPDRVAGLLKDLLHQRPELAQELADLLGPAAAVSQTLVQTGNGNQAVQVAGNGNTVVGRR